MNNAIVVCGLGYGDEGKGTVVDFLAREYENPIVIRYNGGSQAGHNVVLPDGRHHCFSQFGSGTFVDGCRTYLSEYMIVNPFNLMNENEHLESLGVHDALDRLTIDSKCRIVTPMHVYANRIKEILRGNNKHGSVGEGIGEVVQMELEHDLDLRIGNCFSKEMIAEILTEIRDVYTKELWDGVVYSDSQQAKSWFENFIIFARIDEWATNYNDFYNSMNINYDMEYLNRFFDTHTLIFEGAQGVLLDEQYGFAPYTTWSDTTLNNAMFLLKDYKGKITKLGVIRSYMTRHGAGPFVSEFKNDEIAGGLVENIAKKSEHNNMNPWQDNFRNGYFDELAFRYALKVSGVDTLAITHMDVLEGIKTLRVCTHYFDQDIGYIYSIPAINRHWEDQLEFTKRLEKVVSLVSTTESFLDTVKYCAGNIPIVLTSSGQTYQDKVWLQKI